jgi:hypothetical protein
MEPTIKEKISKYVLPFDLYQNMLRTGNKQLWALTREYFNTDDDDDDMIMIIMPNFL